MAFWKARARNTDPITSHEAAKTITTPELLTRMQMVERLLKIAPATDEQLVASFQGCANFGMCKPASPQGIRSARANLVKDGKVEALETTFGTTAMGNRCHVWKWVG